MRMLSFLIIGLFVMVVEACTPTYDVVVVGGGAGGTAAAVEAAR